MSAAVSRRSVGEGTDCPVCGAPSRRSFVIETKEAQDRRRVTIQVCSACKTYFASDYAADRSLIYGRNYAAWGASVDAGEETSTAASKVEAFAAQLAPLSRHVETAGKRLLDVGTGYGYLLDSASALGFDCFGVELSAFAAAKAAARHPGRIRIGSLEGAAYAAESFDVVALTDVLEHIPEPDPLLTEVNRVLRPRGLLLIITPNSQSWTRRLLGGQWFQYKYEHVIYWNPGALTATLTRHAFEVLVMRNNRKRFRLSYYSRYFRRYSLLGPLGRLFLGVYDRLPRRLREWSFSNPVTGEMFVIARKCPGEGPVASR